MAYGASQETAGFWGKPLAWRGGWEFQALASGLACMADRVTPMPQRGPHSLCMCIASDLFHGGAHLLERREMGVLFLSGSSDIL